MQDGIQKGELHWVKEVRFVFADRTTYAYVLMETKSASGLGASKTVWRHRRFPPQINAQQILALVAQNEANLWAEEKPGREPYGSL